jgi:hypothetical protein
MGVGKKRYARTGRETNVQFLADAMAGGTAFSSTQCEALRRRERFMASR